MDLRVVERSKRKIFELISSPASHRYAPPAFLHKALNHNARLGFSPSDPRWRRSLYTNGMTRICLVGSIYLRSDAFLPVHFTEFRHLGRALATSATKKTHQHDEQRKESSKDELDEAVRNLNMAKSKARAKQQQDKHQRIKVENKLRKIVHSSKAVLSMSREDWAKQFSKWKTEFNSTLRHYWHGFKLLLGDTRISFNLLMKLAHGKTLSGVERKQLSRTIADIFRLVPFSVFVIVPFMELLLPVFLKLFPNMLPSTFKGETKEQGALKRKLKARLEYAKFLQETIKEMANEGGSDPATERTAESLDKFLSEERERAKLLADRNKMKEYGIAKGHSTLKELTSLTSSLAKALITAKTLEKQTGLCKISHALAVLASAKAVRTDRQEFLSLVNKEIELYNNMLEKGVAKGEEAESAYMAAREKNHQEKEASAADKVSSAIQDKVDDMLQKLGKEIDDVDAVLDRRWKHLDSDYNGKVTEEEVTAAALYLKETLEKEGIEEVICNLSRDEEGKILIEDIIKLGYRMDAEETDKMRKEH